MTDQAEMLCAEAERAKLADVDRLLAAITHPIRTFAATTEGEP